MGRKYRKRWALCLIIVCFSIAIYNIYINIAASYLLGIILNTFLGILIAFTFFYTKRYIEDRKKEYDIFKNEVIEKSSDSIIRHLSQQRHAFLNIMQVIYGYAQLKKHDRIIEYIQLYGKRIESVGRLYNMGNIKFADMVHNIQKESDNLGIDFYIFIDVPNKNHIPILDIDSVVLLVENITMYYFYILKHNNVSEKKLSFELHYSKTDSSIRVKIPSSYDNFIFPQKELYWDEVQSKIFPISFFKKECSKHGIDITVSEDLKEIKIFLFN